MIEDLFNRRMVVLPDPAHSPAERRFRAIGRAQDGRPVFVVFTIRNRSGERAIRPISARYMHREEIENYEKTYPNL